MESQGPFYLHKLREALATRQRRNPNYSLRAFAKDLAIDSSNLSSILREQRNLPVSRAPSIADKLRLTKEEKALFLASTNRKKMQLDRIQVESQSKRYLIKDKYMRVISEWEYYALLQLMLTDDFQSEIKWIANRLGIEQKRAQVVLNDLLELGFATRDAKGKFERSTSDLETTEDIESETLQNAHVDSISIAIAKLEKVPVNERDYSSMTFAIDPQKLPEAKALIREFQDKLTAYLTEGNRKEVYQLNCQLFPLTKKEKL